MADLKSFTTLKWYYQILIVASVCGIGLGLLWYQFLTPVEEEIAAQQKELKKLQDEVKKAEDKQRVFAQFKKESAELETKLLTLKNVLPMEKETDELLRSVKNAVDESGMKLMNFKPRAQADREVYLEYPIDMEITGNYHDVGTYLDRIRQLPRIVNISGLKLNSRAGGGGASVQATYVATTFVYKEEPVATAPPPKPAKGK